LGAPEKVYQSETEMPTEIRGDSEPDESQPAFSAQSRSSFI
jgi:hypothetical protein